jgi:hypothetical protein
MLATSNPQAALEIDHPQESPDPGTWVVFKPRAGVSRMHRTEFPALVLGEHKEGGLILMVVLEPEDMMLEDRVPFQSHNQENFCWRWRKVSEAERANAMNGDVNRLNDLAKRVTEIEAYLDSEDKLGASVEQLGGRIEAVESVLASDEIEVIEKKMATLEANWDLLKPMLAKAKKGK